MKKIVFIMGLVLSLCANAWAYEPSKDEVMLKIRQETEKYKKECFENEAFYLMSDKAGFITGSDFLTDGGTNASYWYGDLQYMRNTMGK